MKLNEVIAEAYFKDEDLPEQTPTILINNKIVAYPQNFICINGLPKSYKTTFAWFFIQSFITGNEVFNIKVNREPNESICLIDTEQSVYDFTRQSKNFKRNLKVNKLPGNFSAFLFRKYEPETIIKAITDIVVNDKPKIIIIDNLTELVNNPNDMLESKSVIGWLKKLSAENNIVIICLLHNAKSTMASIGNLGSYADRGAQTSVTVKHDKDAGTTTMEATLMRSDKYFTPITIKFDEELKTFVQVETEIKEKANSRKFILMNITDNEHKDKLKIIFIKVKTMPYSELVAEIGKMYGVGLNISKQQILPYLRGNEFITSDNGLYEINKNK
jgi:hypothetical protein